MHNTYPSPLNLPLLNLRRNTNQREPKVPPTESSGEHNLPTPSHDPLPSGEDSLKLKELMDFYTNLSNKVLDLESEVIDIKSTDQARIEKLENRVERLEEENRGRKIADIDADVEINLEKAQAEAYNLDLDHQKKVLSMLDVNDEKPPDVEEVLEVIKAANLITEVVTTVRVDVNAANVQDIPITVAEATKVSVPRKRRGVIIQDPEETTTTITVQPKGMTYDEIRPFFEKHYNYNQSFLKEANEGVKVPKKEVSKEKEVEVESSKKEDATHLTSKIPIIDYKIHTERNRPYFKITRADGNHKLFLSFSTMLKNFDREDLESL
uniref:Uncharacterized protein n=1 Tax=Tanacetum cinerariifolium TaxID=118510 RepID=A0A699JTA1_TANCI|nr:hypothetical protein [Tanacetum cinerariifolium]